MPDLILSEREQRLVRSLLAIDPVPGDPVAVAPVLELVSQLYLDRRSRPFSARDLDLLRMIAPALQRLLRERPTPQLPTTLTLTERRVLQLLATGMTNSAIAAHLGVAPCTVRKHLEHAFPKLGVTNRLAAARVFESGLATRPEAPMFAR